ncbi:hypothetical protein [uncultured Roseobacter sp.]|uniref:hypothetical protein n=1 Tax=uncultured Roseobacter sp. TaxID=114847 RepID=UPI00262E9CDA|nr:hypothetical protein [uncultured Roseobacter sp.]
MSGTDRGYQSGLVLSSGTTADLDEIARLVSGFFKAMGAVICVTQPVGDREVLVQTEIVDVGILMEDGGAARRIMLRLSGATDGAKAECDTHLAALLYLLAHSHPCDGICWLSRDALMATNDFLRFFAPAAAPGPVTVRRPRLRQPARTQRPARCVETAVAMPALCKPGTQVVPRRPVAGPISRQRQDTRIIRAALSPHRPAMRQAAPSPDSSVSVTTWVSALRRSKITTRLTAALTQRIGSEAALRLTAFALLVCGIIGQPEIGHALHSAADVLH